MLLIPSLAEKHERICMPPISIIPLPILTSVRALDMIRVKLNRCSEDDTVGVVREDARKRLTRIKDLKFCNFEATRSVKMLSFDFNLARKMSSNANVNLLCRKMWTATNCGVSNKMDKPKFIAFLHKFNLFTSTQLPRRKYDILWDEARKSKSDINYSRFLECFLLMTLLCMSYRKRTDSAEHIIREMEIIVRSLVEPHGCMLISNTKLLRRNQVKMGKTFYKSSPSKTIKLAVKHNMVLPENVLQVPLASPHQRKGGKEDHYSKICGIQAYFQRKSAHQLSCRDENKLKKQENNKPLHAQSHLQPIKKVAPIPRSLKYAPKSAGFNNVLLHGHTFCEKKPDHTFDKSADIKPIKSWNMNIVRNGSKETLGEQIEPKIKQISLNRLGFCTNVLVMQHADNLINKRQNPPHIVNKNNCRQHHIFCDTSRKVTNETLLKLGTLNDTHSIRVIRKNKNTQKTLGEIQTVHFLNGLNRKIVSSTSSFPHLLANPYDDKTKKESAFRRSVVKKDTGAKWRANIRRDVAENRFVCISRDKCFPGVNGFSVGRASACNQIKLKSRTTLPRIFVKSTPLAISNSINAKRILNSMNSLLKTTDKLKVLNDSLIKKATRELICYQSVKKLSPKPARAEKHLQLKSLQTKYCTPEYVGVSFGFNKTIKNCTIKI